MRKKIIGISFLFLLVNAGAVFAEDGAFDEKNFSATIHLTTDYVSRGISFSGEDPALQGTFDYAHPSGLFTGIWASSWDSGETSSNIETGYYGGYAGTVGNTAYSLSANYYAYPDADDDGAEWNYWEFVASASYTFDQVALTPVAGVGYVYSPDWFGEDSDLNYVNTTLDLALPFDLGLGFEVGYFDLAGDRTTGNGLGLDGGSGYDYVHWRCGLSRTMAGFGLDLSYHDTTETDYFGDLGGSRLVFTVSRTL